MTTRMKQTAIACAMILFTLPSFSQKEKINYDRPYDQRGVSTFETTKDDTVEFKGLKVRIGGSFTQQFQSLSHTNNAIANDAAFGAGTVNLNKLYPLGPGFNLATANLRFDIQLEDGIRVALESYMSSRHHPEFWVKGGYIQVDKLPMFGNPEWFEKYVTVKVGHFGVNYGDQQFRRSDNGNTIFNPFVGNYIMDAFATEIGGELYIRPIDNVFVMAGMTSGIINGDVKDYGDQKKTPSVLAKIGYDNQISDDLRIRFTTSLYMNGGTTRNTLYAGDRTGSRYYLVAEPEYYRNFRAGGAITATNATDRFTSGRISPDFTHKVTSVMFNPFIKFKGLELFGTYEMAQGTHSIDVENRKFNQLAAEVIYRFLPNEQVFVGGRYNVVSGQIPNYTEDISVDRIQLSLGWYTTKNLMVKLEYVTQNYNGFLNTDYRHELNFNGLMLEAAISF
jgi:hypothetical protein